MAWERQLDERIEGMRADLVALRRHLHMYPELSGQEIETSRFLYERVHEWERECRLGPSGCGVIVDVAPDGESMPERFALRADIDALPVQEINEVPYRSQRRGVMHACGHDAHAAVVYGAVAAIHETGRAGQLPWPVAVRGIFQPAEETCQGALAMIDDGAMDGVVAILATHMDPTHAVGTVGLRMGELTANCDEMSIQVRGRGGHGARPHQALDPIAAAAQLIPALYQQITRSIDSHDPVVLTIGQIQAGFAPNVIPDHAELRGTLRTLGTQVRAESRRLVHQVAQGIAAMTGTTIDVQFLTGSNSVANDPRLIQILHHHVTELLGDNGVRMILRPSMGSEDFAFYLDHAPGAMIRLGCSGPGRPGNPLHASNFDIDEDVLVRGSQLLARAAVAWFNPAADSERGSGESLLRQSL